MLTKRAISSKGFTLVELIIVVVIIGILAAISVVGYTGQAKKARANSAYSALSEAVRAASVCLANGDSLAYFDMWAGEYPVCSSTSSTNAVWPNIGGMTSAGLEYDDNDFVNLNPNTEPNKIDITIVGDGSTEAVGPMDDMTITCTNAGCTKSGF